MTGRTSMLRRKTGENLSASSRPPYTSNGVSKKQCSNDGLSVMKDAPVHHLRVSIALVALLLASGCASINFKRAGNTQDFHKAASACRGQVQLTYENCMTAHGWTVAAQHISTERSAQASLSPAHPGPVQVLSATPGNRSVASWWKMGGSSADLAAARKDCGAGSERDVSRASVACLEARGWHGAGR